MVVGVKERTPEVLSSNLRGDLSHANFASKVGGPCDVASNLNMLSLFNSLTTIRANQIFQPKAPGLSQIFARHRSQLAPRKVKWVKRQKGTIPIPIGGSTKGTTLAYGEWGIRIRGNGARFSAKQLQTVEDLIKRKIKVIKGAKVFLRVFPDVPVCIKVRNSCLIWERIQSLIA